MKSIRIVTKWTGQYDMEALMAKLNYSSSTEKGAFYTTI